MTIGNTFGAMFIGAMITMVMYGITTLQTYLYFLYYPKDSHGVKLLVSVIWLLDTLHVIFMCHAMYYYLVSSFGHVARLLDGTWSLFSSIALNILMAFIVQCFYTKRIYQLSPPRTKWWLSFIIALVVLAHFCLGLETVIEFFIKKRFDRLQEVNFVAALPFAITAILSDILIAVALCVLLEKNRSSFEDTNSIINKLIVFAINRCILTSAVAVVEVIVFVSLPHTFYSFAIDFVIGKLYTNSLLATLNSRKSLQGKGNDYSDSSAADASTGFNLASIVSATAPGSVGLIRVGSATADQLRPSDEENGRYHTAASSTQKNRRSYPTSSIS